MAGEDTDRTSDNIDEKEDVVDEMLLLGPCRGPTLSDEGD